MSHILLKSACLAAAAFAVAVPSARAEDEVKEEASAEVTEEITVTPAPAAAKAFRFLPLMRCEEIAGGQAEIRAEGAEAWAPIVPGRYYPFGAEVRLVAKDGVAAEARFALGKEAMLALKGPGAFATRPAAIGEAARTVLLQEGTLELNLPRALPDGLMTVASPDFTCENLAGASRFVTSATADLRTCVIRVVTGGLALKGRHYSIARMGVANQVRLVSQIDKLYTALYGESGDCVVRLDCGVKRLLDPESGDYKNEIQTIDYTLSPKCAAKIWRKISEKSAGGSGRMAVAVQTFDAKGRDKNFRAFFEDRAEVNTGELVPAEAPAEKKDAAAKKGPEDAEAKGEETSEESSEESTGESSESSSETSSSESSGDAAF